MPHGKDSCALSYFHVSVSKRDFIRSRLLAPIFPVQAKQDAGSVTVRADSAEGFDKGKLQNGVMEPLRESDLIN